MARFQTDGIDSLIDSMTKLESDFPDAAMEMLFAGAEEVAEAWKESAIEHDLRDTDSMLESINYSKTPTKTGDIKSVEIYPQGMDKKGVRNAEKAFILHYGTNSAASIARGEKKARLRKKKYKNPGIPATYWVDTADEKAAPKVENRLWDMFNALMDRMGF